MVGTGVCRRLNDAIKDEHETAHRTYRELMGVLEDEGLLDGLIEGKIQNIIRQETFHEDEFRLIAERVGCRIIEEESVSSKYHKARRRASRLSPISKR